LKTSVIDLSIDAIGVAIFLFVLHRDRERAVAPVEYSTRIGSTVYDRFSVPAGTRAFRVTFTNGPVLDTDFGTFGLLHGY